LNQRIAQERNGEEIHKADQKSRKCTLYYLRKRKNINFSAHENSFKNLVYTHEAHIVKLNIDEQDYKAVLHDMQFHPVSDRIIHADFVQIFDDKPIIMDVPVIITGDSVGVKAGGKLIVKRRHLKVKGWLIIFRSPGCRCYRSQNTSFNKGRRPHLR